MKTEELATLLELAQRHIQAAGTALNTIAAALNAEALGAASPANGCPKCGADEKRIRIAGLGSKQTGFCLECRHEWPIEG